MKNFTNNFKQFTSRLSARWLIMALMMLVGTSSAWSAITFTSDDVLFFNMKAVSWWEETTGGANFAYFFNKSTSTNNWSAKAVKYKDDIWYVKIPAGSWEYVILTRNSVTSGPTFDNRYNQTGDIALSSTSNYISKFSEGSTSATWSTQKPTSTASLSASSTSVDTGVGVTLTPSLTSNTTYNEIKSTAYSINPNTGASISGNKFTATVAGTYTVTATITYNPRGYSSLTSTATATKTITVNNPITITDYQLAGFNDWGNPITMTKNGNIYTCTITLTAKEYAVGSEDGFKIIENYSNSTKKWYGNDGTMKRNNCSGWTMEENKKNCGITADVAGTYTFTFDATTKNLTVTYPPECITTTFSWGTAPVNMNYGETKNIVATLNPAEAGTVSYNASPAGIITFSDNQYTAVGKGDVTITATASLNDGYCPVSDLTKSIKVTCPTPDQPKLSEGKAILDNCENVVDGSILIENYANYGVGYTFKLDDTSIRPANDGTISVSTAKEYIVKVTNECGTSNQASVTITKTTIRAPRTDFEVSISYPQVAYANNNGSINIDLSGSERNVKYYLYKDGSEVVDSEKTGDGKGLRWEGIKETGTYTVKAYNPCDLGKIGMTSSVDYTCMSNLNIAFADDKTTFCPGEKTTVTITFTGTGKGDENTNPDKYGWQWGGSNYSYESINLNESGITMPLTINGDGSISLAVKSCNSTVDSNTLNFTVVTAPEKPVLDKYSNEICTAESAEITISPYNDSYNYNLYKGEQKVDTPEFNAGVFTVSEAGSYTVTAVEAECGLESVVPSDPFILSTRGTTITPSVAVIHPYEVVTFTAGEQAKWALYTNPSSGSQLSDDDAKYSGKDTAYITKGESRTTTFKGEVADGYVIHATVGDCTASYTFNVVEDPNNCQ